MTFTLPDDLAPELYPLAWLTDTWRGYGILAYGEITPKQAVYQEMTFDHDDGPYLRQTATIWTAGVTRSRNLDFGMPGLQGASLLAPAQTWSTETTHRQPVGQEQPDGAEVIESAEGDADTKGSGGSLVPVTQLKLVSADPAGHVTVQEGWAQKPRAQISTQTVGQVHTAVPVGEMTCVFGPVSGNLMWIQDMTAFGRGEATAYASGRLGHVNNLDGPAAQPSPALDLTKPEGEPSTFFDSFAPAPDDAEPTA